METARSELADRFEAYASLVRIPNLFTTPPDVVLGAALAVTTGASASPIAVATVAVASMALYAGGTTLNDYFDSAIDRTERPERPIPSGRIRRHRALALGISFLIAGVLVATLASPSAGVTAVLLAFVVLLYDGWLKGDPAGFLAMGSARGLDVLLGASAVIPFWNLPRWTLSVPIVVAVYVTAVTAMAAGETSGTDRTAVVVGAVGALHASIAVPIALLWARAPPHQFGVGTALAVGFVVWVGRPLAAAVRDPGPGTVGPAVGACVVGIVVLDAAFAALAGVAWSALALSFLVPSVGLARTFDVT